MTPYRDVRFGNLSYPVYIAAGLLENVGSIAQKHSHASSRFVVTSPRVHSIIQSRLGEVGPAIFMEDGEQLKTLESVDRIITRLIEEGARRDALLIAIGGGVVGDTAGFAASIFLRGIDLIHVPTTLLAQVDSSIGGKVAVNHRLGKNLIGSFYPPRAVVCDIEVLTSLPERELRSGLFEALKEGVIADPRLFELTANGADLVEIVQRAIDVKADIVSEDSRESDQRRLLNYGHTVGHGIEAALNYDLLSHGDAVAWGMVGANAVAVRRGVLSPRDSDRILEAIDFVGPERIVSIDRGAVLRAIEYDKKFTSSKRVMILPRRIGECLVAEDVSEGEIEYAVDAALEKAVAG